MKTQTDETKHTANIAPGEWYANTEFDIRQKSTHELIASLGDHNGPFYRVPGEKRKCGPKSWAIAEAHTRLFASAPIMLRALQNQAAVLARVFTMLNAYAKGDHMNDWGRVEPQAVLAQVYGDLAAHHAELHSAIARATGGTE